MAGLFQLSRFPAQVIGGNLISVTKVNGVYTIACTFAAPEEINALPVAARPLTGTELLAIFQGGVTRQIESQFLGNVQQLDKGTRSVGTETFVVSDRSLQKLTVGGAITIALSGWPDAGTRGDIEIELVNGGAFAEPIWPSIVWMRGDGSSGLTFSSMGVVLQAAGSNFVALWSTDAGATIYGRAI